MSTRNTDNSQNTNMGPDHTALLLSGPDEETPSGPVAPPQPPGSHSINSVAASDGTETSPTEGITQSLQRVRRRMLDRLSAFDAAAQSFQDAVSDVQSSRPHLHSESSENRRAHLLDPLVRVRRDTDPSDSSTIIGRRVAARTALNASRSGPRPGSSGLPEHSTLPLLDDTAARIMALADSLQQDLNELMRRRESHAARAAVTAAARYDSQLNAAASASLAGLRGVTSTEQGSTGEYGLEALLREINRGDGDTSLQLLQRSSATNNASADAPRSRSRADIIMDSWASELDNPPLPPLHEDSTRPFSSWFGDEPTDYSATRSEVTEHRTYRVRRRLNSDGEEYVHSIRMDDSEDVDPFSWMRPEGSRHPRLRPREGTSVPTSSNSDSRQRRERVDQIRRDIRSTTSDTPRRRRRGWGAYAVNHFQGYSDIHLQLALTKTGMRFLQTKKKNTSAPVHRCAHGLLRSHSHTVLSDGRHSCPRLRLRQCAGGRSSTPASSTGDMPQTQILAPQTWSLVSVMTCSPLPGPGLLRKRSSPRKLAQQRAWPVPTSGLRLLRCCLDHLSRSGPVLCRCRLPRPRVLWRSAGIARRKFAKLGFQASSSWQGVSVIRYFSGLFLVSETLAQTLILSTMITSLDTVSDLPLYCARGPSLEAPKLQPVRCINDTSLSILL
ncbi:hypothetical protein OBBRIDRAFT_416102 [Obba rivulosa]|uniref:Uncharacterized protein n=1 Tax=Obba rivulosa TaxID=1052685 RepID=A0A8E2AYH9_9APHY|nr:hypothetical protein OBBRIDRAFT_416102 [Obba rivulosa]